MPLLQLPLTIEQFDQLPRHPAYKYEYISGQAWLTPRPKHYHAMLDLQQVELADDVPLRRLESSDWDDLASLFSSAFRGIQPFGSLGDDARRDAARKSLERTRTGGDGPLIEPASFVALDREDRELIGAILITLLPDTDPTGWDAFHWPEPPPADCIELRLGRPHLTWIFVSPWVRGEGAGTALLAAAVRELITLGHKQLATTFLDGNESSMLWHWRNGFRLLAHPGSKREMKKHLEQFRR
jgi:hypothetical protein